MFHVHTSPVLLSQFAANSNRHVRKDTTLFLLVGNHSLGAELSLAHVENFSMIKYVTDYDSDPVFVQCTNQSHGGFKISKTTFFSIKGLHFIGCSGNEVDHTGEFVLEDTIFQNADCFTSVLKLNTVTAATIVKSSNSISKFYDGYLEVDPKLNLHSNCYMTFSGNYANYGGALYVADNTSAAACSYNYECFIQLFALQPGTCANFGPNTFFSENTATEYGSNFFGGLLDRCTLSRYAETYYCKKYHDYNGITYLGNISNITLDSIASSPIQVCFCNMADQLDCSYQLPLIRVMKGETFTVPLVAFDHVYNLVETRVNSSLAFPKGGFAEGQQAQKVSTNCIELIFNVFSPEKSEKVTLVLSADGPCGSSTPSI